MTRLAASALTVRRGGRAILDDVSLTLDGGALIAVLGPNGAGKSTLLACLAGLLAPDSGEVTLDGVPLPAIGGRALARRRAYLPQSPRAEWPIAVERLVALGFTAHLPAFGNLRSDQTVRIDRALAAADLVDRRDQPATTLSGGELARAMLARALVSDPAVLIADEPLAGLDPRHALEGVTRLRALAEAGTLVVASLHDLTLAARYAHQIVMLHEGRLVCCGATSATLTATTIERVFEVAADVRAVGSPHASVDLGLRPTDDRPIA